MIELDISYENPGMENRAPQDFVQAVLGKILALVEKYACEVSCTFVSDATMSGMNSTYRGKKGSTDILSFVQTDDSDGFQFPQMEEQETEVLGDIVICLDAMEHNCIEFQVPPREELVRLLVHGVLHLIGWDHATNDLTEPMLKKQEELLKIVMEEYLR